MVYDMEKINIVQIAGDILNVMEKYFMYIFPGAITVFIYHFSKARETKLNKSTLCICVIISYIYNMFYKSIANKSTFDYTFLDCGIIFLFSIFLPLIWFWISKMRLFQCALNKIGFNTSLEDSAWDYIQCRAKKKEGIVLKIFLDEKNIMYEGSLRYRESDLNKEQIICLSGYRRYVKKSGKYKVSVDYNNDNSRWVLINIKDITRAEIKYESSK